MVRMLENEEMRTERRIGRRVPTPSADEVRALVEGPTTRRPIRWMRWLGAALLLVAGAGVAAFVALDDDPEFATYLVPASSEATQGSLTQADYLPATSGEVYNYQPVPLAIVDPDLEAGGPAAAVYLPATSGAVWIHNPVVVMPLPIEAGGPAMSEYLPATSGEVYNHNPVVVMPLPIEAGGPTVSEYLPVTSGEVYNYNPSPNQT